MNHEEAIALAAETFSALVRDISGLHYTEDGASLSWNWIVDPEKDGLARAHSLGLPRQPPQHMIRIYHQFVIDLYEDASSYCRFAENELGTDRLSQLYPDFDPRPSLPEGMDLNVAIHNMFMASLTWVFFHELGHCSQEHESIRRMHSLLPQSGYIDENECPSSLVSQADSAMRHAMEFAADAEATAWCITELGRHFLAPYLLNELGEQICQIDIEPDNEGFKEFRANLFLLVCAVTLVFCRFNGSREMLYSPLPQSTHPLPLRRLERCLPQIWEMLDVQELAGSFHGLSRRQLVCIGIGASTSSCLFWLKGHCSWPREGEVFLPRGLPQDPHIETYWDSVINSWDAIKGEVAINRRYGSELGLLNFSHAFRELIRHGYNR
jgi:hypothetical protein